MTIQTCTTCVRPADAPYCVEIGGLVDRGCIDACHGSHLTEGLYKEWYNRPAAKAQRVKHAARIKALTA